MYVYEPSHDKLKIHDYAGGFANIKRLLHDIFHIGPGIGLPL